MSVLIIMVFIDLNKNVLPSVFMQMNSTGRFNTSVHIPIGSDVKWFIIIARPDMPPGANSALDAKLYIPAA